MKTKLNFLLWFAVVSLTTLLHGANLSPVVLKSEGTVTANGGPAELKKGIKIGSILETGKKSKAAVAIAPGQLVILKENTKVKLTESRVETEGGEIVRYGQVELIAGHIGVSVLPDTSAKHKFSIVRPDKDVIQLIGTVVDVTPDTLIVVEGMVQVTSAGGGSLTVAGGQVLVSMADGSVAKIDLATGTATDASGATIALSPVLFASIAQQFAAAVALAISSGYDAAQLSAILTAVEAVQAGLALAPNSSSEAVIPDLSVVIANLEQAIALSPQERLDIYSPQGN